MPELFDPRRESTATGVRRGGNVRGDRTGAAFARSLELRERALAALEQSTQLHARSLVLLSASDDTQARAETALRRRRRSPVGGRVVSTAHRESGRIVWGPGRRAGVAASEASLPREGAGNEATEPPHASWARATILASRTVSVVGSSSPSAGRADGDIAASGSWTVRELDASAIPGARGPRCLVYENHTMVRRLWTYPVEWIALPETVLLRLAGLR